MIADRSRFERAIARFDAAHAEDPARESAGTGEEPRELLYAKRMSAWLERLAPDASEPLRLAVRCQHIRRWSIARGAYPAGVEGYRQWRAAEARAHAETAGKILAEVGYDAATIGRVQALVRKERLKQEPEAQLLEDVVCLVFLENYFAEFAKKHDEEKLLGILRKTWRKMSPRGRQAAQGLALAPEARVLIDKALA
jgi:hypothetical protein